ncbi:MAG: sulfotransferase family protein [Fimbriimonadaceae bacterium]
MPRPNFFIIGAPKCGTTSLNAYLETHPNIYMSPEKEPHFFAEHREMRHAQTEEAYLRLFAGAGPQHAVVGEGSTTTLHSPGALERLRAFAPDARIVVMLRDPVDLVYSMYRHHVYRVQEDQPTFADAWRVSVGRAEGRNWPKTARKADPVQLEYRSFGMLGRHIERLLHLFDRDQVHVILFDDFRKDPGAEYRKVLSFLGVPDDGRTDFEIKNAAKEHGNNPVGKMVLGLPNPVRKVFRALGLKHRVKIMDKVMSTAKPADRTPLPPDIEAEVRAYFRDDVILLEQLIDRDLSHWYQIKTAAAVPTSVS